MAYLAIRGTCRHSVARDSIFHYLGALDSGVILTHLSSLMCDAISHTFTSSKNSSVS